MIPVDVRASIALAAAFAVGCDLPTDLPVVETRWIVPTEETRFGVNELLPGDVSLSADSSAFIVDFDPAAFSATLGSLCAACALADGATVPKPPFLASLSSQIDFPPEVSAVSVLGGQVVFELRNGLNFDPIRPGGAMFGSLTLTLTDDDDGDVVASLVIEGTDTGFAAGSTLTRALVLNATDVNGSLTADVVVNSPLGDAVTVRASDALSVTATPVNVRVSGVTIDVANRSVNLDPVSLDLTDVDQDIEDRVVSGSLTVDVTNPFGIGAALQISIAGPTISTIQKSAPVTALPASTVVIAFTSDELKSILGADVVLSGGAVVDPGAGSITVSPGMELVLAASLDLTLRLGGGN